MKRKITIALFLALLLVIFFFLYCLYQDKKYSKLVNNTLNKLKKDYEIKLVLNNNYTYDDREFTSKIIYTESKKDNKYKYQEKIYDNGTLRHTNSCSEKKDCNFDLNFNYLFKNVKVDSKEIKVNVKVLNKFLYGNGFDTKDKTRLYIDDNGNYINKLSFTIKNSEEDITGIITIK